MDVEGEYPGRTPAVHALCMRRGRQYSHGPVGELHREADADGAQSGSVHDLEGTAPTKQLGPSAAMTHVKSKGACDGNVVNALHAEDDAV